LTGGNDVTGRTPVTVPHGPPPPNTPQTGLGANVGLQRDSLSNGTDCTDLKLLTIQFSPVSCHFFPLSPTHSTFPSILFSLEHPQPVPPSQSKHQVSHPYKTTANFTVLYVLVFILLSNQTEKCCHLPTKLHDVTLQTAIM
jgi:hypothetical protein